MAQLDHVHAGLIFGSDTGNTEEVGGKIITELKGLGCEVDMFDVADASSELLEAFDFLILGIPTWDFGGIQEDWEEFEAEILNANLKGKIVALYGLGDQFGYADFFIDAVGWLHERVLKAGASVVGYWSTEGYEVEASLAFNEDKTIFYGLAIDEDQQFELTDERVASWVAQIADEFKQVAAA